MTKSVEFVKDHWASILSFFLQRPNKEVFSLALVNKNFYKILQNLLKNYYGDLESFHYFRAPDFDFKGVNHITNCLDDYTKLPMMQHEKVEVKKFGVGKIYDLTKINDTQMIGVGSDKDHNFIFHNLTFENNILKELKQVNSKIPFAINFVITPDKFIIISNLNRLPLRHLLTIFVADATTGEKVNEFKVDLNEILPQIVDVIVTRGIMTDRNIENYGLIALHPRRTGTGTRRELGPTHLFLPDPKKLHITLALYNNDNGVSECLSVVGTFKKTSFLSKKFDSKEETNKQTETIISKIL